MNNREAKEILDHNWTKLVNPDYSDEELGEAQNLAIKALEQTEWISVKEAYAKGEWLFEPTQNINNPWKCSCCGHRAGRYKYKTYKFCPWCGAKMDRGDEE